MTIYLPRLDDIIVLLKRELEGVVRDAAKASGDSYRDWHQFRIEELTLAIDVLKKAQVERDRLEGQ